MQVFGFSSAKKMASVLVQTEGGYRLYNKVSKLQLDARYLPVLLCKLCAAPLDAAEFCGRVRMP